MQKFIALLFLSAIACNQGAFSQTDTKVDSLGLPGDNLNLYAVLDLFQKSETFEIFEKQLNSEDSKINNLDLNNDDKTDYIKVIDHQNGDNHAIVLQVPVNDKETQDVAVIEIEKNKDGKVMVQIIGNEELYGKDYIVEPKENDPNAKTADTKSAPADGNNTTVINNTTNNYYGNSNQWPIVTYVYAPSYVVYVSPWGWYSYPMWWRPWSPWYFHNYYWHHHNHYHHHHHGWYHRTSYYRTTSAHALYGPHRSVSATVMGNRKANVYNKTYASKSRAGDGKISGGNGKANPAYDSPAEKGRNTKPVSPRQKGNSEVSKPSGENSKGSGSSRPSAKPSSKPSGSGKATRSGGGSKPSSKPSGGSAPRQGGSSGKKGGGKGGR